MINIYEVNETNNMIEHEKLDAVSYTHLADVAHLCAGNQGQDAADHAKACPEDGDHRQLAAGDHGGHAGLDGGLHLYILQGKIPQGFIAHEHGTLLGERTEFIGSRGLVPEEGNFVLNQRVVKNHYIIHNENAPL